MKPSYVPTAVRCLSTESAVDQGFGQLDHNHVNLRLRSVFEVKVAESTVVELILVEDLLHAAIFRSSKQALLE